jgi:hypothetical protein
MTFIQAFIKQLLVFLIYTAYWLVKFILLYDTDDITEILPGYLKNKYVIISILFVWFGVGTWYYMQYPVVGFWNKIL